MGDQARFPGEAIPEVRERQKTSGPWEARPEAQTRHESVYQKDGIPAMATWDGGKDEGDGVHRSGRDIEAGREFGLGRTWERKGQRKGLVDSGETRKVEKSTD